MGGTVSSAAGFPASTSSLCVLPLRTHGQSHFSIRAGPMPAALVGRMAEAEFASIIDKVNGVTGARAQFGVFSLLLPFALIDLLTVLLLCSIDPGLLISPWEYPLADLFLPLAIEFGLIFCGFPLMVHAVNCRMANLQAAVREKLDEASHQCSSRGVNFQLKQGVLANGAGTNLWLEVQIAPLLKVLTPTPVPTLYPVLMPSAQGTPVTGAGQAGSAPAGSSGCGAGAASNGSSKRPEGASSSSNGSRGAPAATSAAGAAGAAGAGAAAAPSMAEEAQAAAAAGTLTPQHAEYLRVLQENQLLRQYLQQYQVLVRLQAQHAQALGAQGGAGQPPCPAQPHD